MSFVSKEIHFLRRTLLSVIVRFRNETASRSLGIGLPGLLLFAVGCTTIVFPYTPADTPSSLLSFAYVESAFSNTISMFTVSPTGLWTATSPATIATGNHPESLVVDPSGRFVYVPNAHDNNVSQYVIDLATGVLSPNKPATVPSGAVPEDLAIDPFGRFLYTADTGGNSISMYIVDKTTGALVPTNPATVPTGSFLPYSSPSGPVGIVADPLGRFMFAPNIADAINVFAIDAVTGVLSLASTLHVLTQMGKPAIDPGGRFLYVHSVGATSEVLLSFSIDRVFGQLNRTAFPPVVVGKNAAWIAIDPTGRYLYVVNRGDQTISEFTTHPDGSLTPMQAPLVFDPGQPWQILIDPSGELAYVSNELTNRVDIYRIGPTGELLGYSSAKAGDTPGGMGIARKQ